MNETLGQRIKRLRLEKEMTQEELAQRIAGPNRGMVSKWESDSNRPTIDHLQGLSRVLGISFDELITGCRPNYIAELQGIADYLNPLIEYMKNEHHPYAALVITHEGVRLVETKTAIPTSQLMRS